MIKKAYLSEIILYSLIFVPFLPSFLPNLYVAPYALILSTVFFFLIKEKTIPNELVILFFLFCVSLMLLVNGFDYNTLRILAGYYSIFIIACSTYFILRMNKRINNNLIYNIFIIWFIVGLIQYFINKEFMSSFVVIVKSTTDRGVTGLAPEPSYYASVMLFFSIISYVNNHKLIQTILLSCLSIIFISSSTTGLVVLLSFLIVYSIVFNFKKKTFVVFFITSIFFLISYLNFDSLSGTRIHKLVKSTLKSPVTLFVKDASVNARVWHIVGSFAGSYDNYLLPRPINNFKEYTSKAMKANIQNVHPRTIRTLNNKPMTGTGQMFFNLGIISLLYFFILFKLSYKCFKSKKEALFITLCIFLLMTTAIPLSFPMFGFIYGLLAYKTYKEPYENIPSIRKSR